MSSFARSTRPVFLCPFRLRHVGLDSSSEWLSSVKISSRRKKQKIWEGSRKNDGFKNKIGKKENAESQQENSDLRSDIYKALIFGLTLKSEKRRIVENLNLTLKFQ